MATSIKPGSSMGTGAESCLACHNLTALGPLTKRKVPLRSPLGYRMLSSMTDFDARGQWGYGRVALLDRTFKELEDAANNGCEYCDLVVRACAAFQVSGEEINIWLEPKQNPRITVWTGGGDERSYLELFVQQDSEHDWGLFQRLWNVSSHAGAERGDKFLKDNLQLCVSTHSACAKAPHYMPLRLLEVVHDGNRCRLVDSSKFKPEKYVALSYRWGDAAEQAHRTTRETLTSSLDYISKLKLPRAIRDALALTSAVNARYLWVDALCIIQDDNRDWQTHVAYMGDIYQNAHLVVAAASAEHSNDSFLHRPNRPLVKNLPFTCGGYTGSVSVLQQLASGIHDNYEGMFGGTDPLESRGWALQESVLATRLIVYSASELQWVCRTHQTCESRHMEGQNERLQIDDEISAPEAYKLWHRLIKRYSQRYLTYEEDKLPAIAGIASKIATITGSEYCAGLWKENLIHDLCWERHLWEILPWRSPEHWLAPSFSWASVKGNVLYNDDSIAGRHGTSLCEVLEANATPVSLHMPLGGVTDGHVRLRGPLREALLFTHPEAELGYTWTHMLHLLDSPGKIAFRSDVPLSMCSVSTTELDQQSSNNVNVHTAERAIGREVSKLEGVRAWVLVLGFWHEHYLDSSDTDMWITCLLLGRPDHLSGAYQRLGITNTHWPPWMSKYGELESNDLSPWMYEAEKMELTIR